MQHFTMTPLTSFGDAVQQRHGDGERRFGAGTVFAVDPSGALLATTVCSVSAPPHDLRLWGVVCLAPGGGEERPAGKALPELLVPTFARPARAGPVHGLAWSPDGTTLLVAARGSLEFWRVPAWRAAAASAAMAPLHLHTLHGLSQAPRCGVAVHPGGTLAAHFADGGGARDPAAFLARLPTPVWQLLRDLIPSSVLPAAVVEAVCECTQGIYHPPISFRAVAKVHAPNKEILD